MAARGLLAVSAAALFLSRVLAADEACEVGAATEEEGEEFSALQRQFFRRHLQRHFIPEVPETLKIQSTAMALEGSYMHLVAGEAAFRATDQFPEVCLQIHPDAAAVVEREKLCRIERERVPSIYSGLLNRPSHLVSMTEQEKTDFEHDVSTSLITSTVVAETSAEFGKRLFAFVVAGGKQYDGKSEDEALVAAFGPRCSVNNAGFAGLNPADIRDILTVDGNVREIWCLMYCLSKNQAWVDNVFSMADKSFFVSTFGASAGASAWKVVQERRILVEATMQMPRDERYTLGTLDYLFPPPASWVDFNFDAELPARLGGGLLWRGARQYNGGCKEVNFTTADTSIVPPLSKREIVAECEGETPPCKLRWMPGLGCYVIEEHTLFWNRTHHNGYRRVAGPSGTTANALQLALSLGFSQSDLLAFRTVMLAWLVTANDHSFMEVMLSAQSFIDEPALSLQWGLSLTDSSKYADFERIWPAGYRLQTSWGPEFRRPGGFLP